MIELNSIHRPFWIALNWHPVVRSTEPRYGTISQGAARHPLCALADAELPFLQPRQFHTREGAGSTRESHERNRQPNSVDRTRNRAVILLSQLMRVAANMETPSVARADTTKEHKVKYMKKIDIAFWGNK